MTELGSTEEKFHAAVEIIKNLPKSGPIKPSNDVKLKFYSYYKQAMEGPCELPKPGFWDIINRAKWDAWNRLENMSKEEAMLHYVEEFVEIMKETIPRDPDSLVEFYNIMGPYVNLVPKDVLEKHGLVNGNATFLNNNIEETFAICNESKPGKQKFPTDFSENNHLKDSSNDGYIPITNGHSINGNDSDSEEFSDTLEQVGSESEETRTDALINDKNVNGSAIKNVVLVRGGGEQKVGSGESNSPAAGSSMRGNRSSRPIRSSDNPLYIPSNNNVSGAGGNRRSGGNLPVEITSDVNEQLALAVIRMQQIMEQVVVRLDSLETLLTQRQPPSNAVQTVNRKSHGWSFFGISPKAALLIIAWPLIVQWLIYIYRKRNRRV